MERQMVAMDRDRTLVDPQGKIPSSVFDVFRKIINKNKYVVIVTDGGKNGVERLLSQNDYVMGNEIFPQVIIANPYVYFLEDNNFEPDVNWNKKADKINSETKDLIKELVDEIVCQIEEFQFRRAGYRNLRFDKIEEAKRVERLSREIMQKKGISCVVIERNRTGLCFRNSRLIKGNILSKLATKMNIDEKEIVTIGDSGNDKSLLDKSFNFFPACPVNAEKIIKKIIKENGGIIASKAYGEGVVEIIKQTLLS